MAIIHTCLIYRYKSITPAASGNLRDNLPLPTVYLTHMSGN
ncbi:hypothetical protein AT1219_11033 [Vibrio alginolyticus]